MGRWILVVFSLPATSSTITQELINAVNENGLNEFFVFRPYRAGPNRNSTIMSVGRLDKDMPENMREAATSLLRSYELSLPDWRSNERETLIIRRIRYRRPNRIASSDPLSHEDENMTPTVQRLDHTDSYNKLLHWLSAHGQGTWQQFKMACNTLGLDLTYEYSRRILRRLRLLGHIEVTSDGQKWFITPPSLVATGSAAGGYRTFLAGQRSPALLHSLRNATQVEVEIEIQPDADAPEVVRATFDSQDQAAYFARNFSQRHHPLFLAGLAGHRIACALPDLVSWENQLSSPAVVLGNYRFELWEGGEFNTLPFPSQTGMYRLTHLADHYRHPQLTLFYDADRDLWRRADWYGLRYLTLRRTGEHIEFVYDHNLRTLRIDRNQRLPHMYERALVLASGSLPVFRNDQIILGDVPAELGRTVANKLEAEFVE